IPAMNRELVEMATHPQAMVEIVNSLGKAWQQHETYILGTHSADRSHANLLLLPRDKPFGDEEFPRDLNERIKTRLGEGDRKIDLDAEITSPFGNKIRELTLPAHYTPNADEEATAENIAIEQGKVRFDFADKTFIYDRLGLRPVDADYEGGG
ncbi:TPA: CRISPR-associated helicase/endonuclease Cas3, partial [Candidatus Acetothermia bacterium]|nr:CRISPR-associated helicase/endonuclease Cas3 [Candidatus Acetothermia bacterium]